MGRKPKVKKISSSNKKIRVRYGEEHQNDNVESLWQWVFFTDEAHYDPGQISRQNVLREEGTRLNTENMQEMPDMKGNKLHMAASINWHVKGPLKFYNDENDTSAIVSAKEPKPRRSKYLQEEDYQKLVREWEARQPHEAEIKPKGNSMTNEYYTRIILPVYLNSIEQAKLAERRALLQEDNDPSHGTRGVKDNLAKSFKKEHNIELFKHPAQSPDLNPSEGVWNILKPRVRKREWHSMTELKRVILDEWDKITMDEIRARISEMPWRCKELIRTGGKPIKSALW